MESTPHSRLPCDSAPLFGGALRSAAPGRESTARAGGGQLSGFAASPRGLLACCVDADTKASGRRTSCAQPAPQVCVSTSLPRKKKGERVRASLHGDCHNGRAPRFRLLLPPSTVRPSAWPPAAQRRPPPHCVRSSFPAQERDPGMGEATRFLLLWEARGHFWAAAIFLSLYCLGVAHGRVGPKRQTACGGQVRVALSCCGERVSSVPAWMAERAALCVCGGGGGPRV